MTLSRREIIVSDSFGSFYSWRWKLALTAAGVFAHTGPEILCVLAVFAMAGMVAEMSNVMLVRQCAKHTEREELWQEFLRRFLEHLRRWALQALRRYDQKEIAHYREAVNDLVQEVCLRLVQNDCHALHEFRGSTDDALNGYLRVITQHVALNRVREGRAQKRPQLTRSLDQDRDEGSGDFTAAVQRKLITHSDNERARLRDLQEQINYYLDVVLRGPQKHRDKLLFQLYHFDGLSAEEIAAVPGIGMKPHAVEVAVNRVCHRLTKHARQIME